MVEYPDRPCPICQTPMTGRQRTGCSGRCRAEASRKRKVEFVRGRKRKVRDLLEEALEVLSEGDQL